MLWSCSARRCSYQLSTSGIYLNWHICCQVMCQSDNIHLALVVLVAINVIEGGLAEVLHENILFDFKNRYSNTCCAFFFKTVLAVGWPGCICKRLEELCLTWQYSWRCLCLNSLKGFVLTGWHLVHSVPKCCCVSCFLFTAGWVALL